MSWQIENPPSLMVEQGCNLFNTTPASALPAASGQWGIDNDVWKALIALTKTKCRALGIPVTSGDDLKGMCIWASVVAAKFFVHRMGCHDSRVVRVRDTSDHYFVAVRRAGATVAMADITCNQFGGPDFIVGKLSDIKGAAQRVKVGGNSLYDAYKMGAATSTFVL